MKWISSSTAVTVGLGFLQTVVLSRILDPADFGLMAMMWVVVGLFHLFTDMGMSNAIVQKQDATMEQLSSVYWITVATGAAMALAAVAAAPWTAHFFQQPMIVTLMPLIGITLMIGSFGQCYEMLAQRELRFDRLAVADSLAALASLTVATATALGGQGVRALVYGGIASVCVRSGYLVAAGQEMWRPSRHFRWADLRGFARFGVYQMGERITNYSWNNVDYLLVGRYLGAESLGIYRLAYETIVRPLGTVNPILNTVSYPLFSQRQHDDEALRRGYLELLRLLCTITFPLLVGLAVVAPVAVDAVFGKKWAEAAPIIRILCLLGALRSITNPSAALLLAKGRVGTGFVWNLLLAVVSVIAFSIAAPRGILVLSWTVVGVMALVVVTSWKFYYHDPIRLPLGAWLATMLKPALYSVVMGGGVALVSVALAGIAMPGGVRLSILVATGGLVYVALLLALERSYVTGLLDLLRRQG